VQIPCQHAKDKHLSNAWPLLQLNHLDLWSPRHGPGRAAARARAGPAGSGLPVRGSWQRTAMGFGTVSTLLALKPETTRPYIHHNAVCYMSNTSLFFSGATATHLNTHQSSAKEVSFHEAGMLPACGYCKGLQSRKGILLKVSLRQCTCKARHVR